MTGTRTEGRLRTVGKISRQKPGPALANRLPGCGRAVLSLIFLQFEIFDNPDLNSESYDVNGTKMATRQHSVHVMLQWKSV